jgi:hypothetical protein
LLLAENFNTNENCFDGICTYTKEKFTVDLSIGFKTIVKEKDEYSLRRRAR